MYIRKKVRKITKVKSEENDEAKIKEEVERRFAEKEYVEIRKRIKKRSGNRKKTITCERKK